MSKGPLYGFHGEESVQVLCPFFNYIDCVPGLESCEFSIYFGDQNPCPRYHWQLYLHIWLVPFNFVDVFFSCAEVFSFDVVPFYSFLYIPCPRECIGENIAMWYLKFFWPMFSSRTFMVSQLIFKSFIHLEFIFVYGVIW